MVGDFPFRLAQLEQAALDCEVKILENEEWRPAGLLVQGADDLRGVAVAGKRAEAGDELPHLVTIERGE